MVYDLRGKLEKKFGREFFDPTDVESRRKADEDRARALAKDSAERNAATEHYFTKVTDVEANKAKAERIKKKREFVILKNKNLNPEDEDGNATHHLMNVGETLYVRVGIRSCMVSWGFDHDFKWWWIKRKVGPVEWNKNPAQFQTFTKREVARDFPSMHTAESIVTPAEKGVRDPYTNKRMKIVDQVEFLNLAYEDLEVLARNHIRATEKYEEIAKEWTAAVVSAIHIRTKGFGGFKDHLGGSSGR
ncbi:hypothetical protein Hanom_Chr04g00345991 [Helianthus anomalus]